MAILEWCKEQPSWLAPIFQNGSKLSDCKICWTVKATRGMEVGGSLIKAWLEMTAKRFIFNWHSPKCLQLYFVVKGTLWMYLCVCVWVCDYMRVPFYFVNSLSQTQLHVIWKWFVIHLWFFFSFNFPVQTPNPGISWWLPIQGLAKSDSFVCLFFKISQGQLSAVTCATPTSVCNFSEVFFPEKEAFLFVVFRWVFWEQIETSATGGMLQPWKMVQASHTNRTSWPSKEEKVISAKISGRPQESAKYGSALFKRSLEREAIPLIHFCKCSVQMFQSCFLPW